MQAFVREYALLIERVIFMQIVIFVTVLAGYTLFLHERLAFDVRACLTGLLYLHHAVRHKHHAV